MEIVVKTVKKKGIVIYLSFLHCLILLELSCNSKQ